MSRNIQQAWLLRAKFNVEFEDVDSEPIPMTLLRRYSIVFVSHFYRLLYTLNAIAIRVRYAHGYSYRILVVVIAACMVVLSENFSNRESNVSSAWQKYRQRGKGREWILVTRESVVSGLVMGRDTGAWRNEARCYAAGNICPVADSSANGPRLHWLNPEPWIRRRDSSQVLWILHRSRAIDPRRSSCSVLSRPLDISGGREKSTTITAPTSRTVFVNERGDED